MKIEFLPGCFDDFEGTQEELDHLIEELQRLADSGQLEILAIEQDAYEDEDEDWSETSFELEKRTLQ